MNTHEIRKQMFFGGMRRVFGGPYQSGGERGFLPITIRALLPDQLPFTLYLKTLEAEAQKVKYLPYCEAGEILRKTYLTRLQRRGIIQLYFREEDLDKVIAYCNRTLLLLTNEGPEANRRKMAVFFEHLHLSIRRAWLGALCPAHIRQASWHVDWLIQQLGKGMVPYHSLWEMLLGDYCLYKHAVNVFLLAVAFLVFLGRSHAECKTMGIAALFHDMGLTRIPPDILFKPGPLSPEERLEVHRHPEIAVEMLTEYAEMPPESLRLIAEHHENADGSGYPQGLGICEQHDHTPLLRLVDAFDALISPRPYRPAQTPFQTLKTIQEQWGPHGPVYHRHVIKNFIKFLAL